MLNEKLNRLKGTANSSAIRRHLRITREKKIEKICNQLQSTKLAFINLAVDKLIEEIEKEDENNGKS